MRDVVLFAEDDAQERFLAALVQRLADEHATPIHLHVVSKSGGWPRVLAELAKFGKRCVEHNQPLPDMVVVGIDANCQGSKSRRALIDARCDDRIKPLVVSAVPDPHIERWYLLDGEAFKNVFGRGCDAPDQKCEKGRYKELLANAIRAAGVEPLLGGLEYAEDLARVMNLHRASKSDDAFKAFVDDATRRLK